jgi:hypothetical protein
MLTLFVLWLTGCTIAAVLNAKFWNAYPDNESREGEKQI